MSSIVEATGPIKHAKVADVATQGDNTLVAAVTGKKIRVLSVALSASGGANTLIFESGTSSGNLTGTIELTDGASLILPHNPCGWFETAAGALLNLILSAATAVGGCLTYQEVG